MWNFLETAPRQVVDGLVWLTTLAALAQTWFALVAVVAGASWHAYQIYDLYQRRKLDAAVTAALDASKAQDEIDAAQRAARAKANSS